MDTDHQLITTCTCVFANHLRDAVQMFDEAQAWAKCAYELANIAGYEHAAVDLLQRSAELRISAQGAVRHAWAAIQAALGEPSAPSPEEHPASSAG